MAEHPLRRSKAPSGGSNTPLVPQLRADPKPKTTRPQASETQPIAPREEGGIFANIFDTILKLRSRRGTVDEAIEDALKGKTK